MAAAVRLPVACGPTATPARSGRRPGSSRRLPFRLQPVIIELEPAAGAPGTLGAAAPADAVSAALSPSINGGSRSSSSSSQHGSTRQWRPLLGHAPQAAEAAAAERVQGSVPAALLPPAAATSDHRLGVQLNEPPQREQEEEQDQEQRDKDFFANVGDAIRTLREDYPLLFMKDLNYAIYRDDLVFKDPNLTFKGLKNYRVIVWSLRFHGRLFLKAAHVQVLRIWQPQDAVIKLRWQINATPRVGSPGTFDGISIYRLDRAGRVYQHEVTDVQLRDPPITNPLLYGLNFILSPRPQVQQMPCPGGYFEDPGEDALPEVLAAAPAGLDFAAVSCASTE